MSTTEAGARLLDTLAPRLAEIENELAALAEYRERPAGTIRINATGHAAEYLAWPRLAPLLQQYPDLNGDFGQDGNELSVRVSGQWTFNTMGMTREAALAGSGLAWLPEDQVLALLEQGRLQSVLDGWCPTFDGYYAYYPSRRHVSVAMRTVLDALRGPMG